MNTHTASILFSAFLMLAGCAPATSQNNPGDIAALSVDPAVCDEDDGGLELPDGFCAVVVADDLGRLRHVAVRENGDVYVIHSGLTEEGGITALRDTTGDGKADIIQTFGEVAGTGIGIHNGYLYASTNTSVWRYPLGNGELVPTESGEQIIGGFPDQGSHEAKSFAFDDSGNIYVNVGGPSNACQENPRSPGSPGLDPCPQLERHGGVWRFDASTAGQSQAEDGTRFSTGIRNSVAIGWNPATEAVYVVQHGRDQLHHLWPDYYTQEESAELPAEELLRLHEGADFGWPYCYYDHVQGRKVLSPEYGGDGEEVGRCADVENPIAAFPGHYAPNALVFYTANQFPERYQGGAFIAFHGSWNRAPEPQKGYQVAFQPLSDGVSAGDWETFADGFKGTEVLESPGDAEYRPTGLAVGPDGSLYVTDSQQGRIWRIMYESR